MNKSTIKNTPNPTSSGSGEGKHDLIDRQAAIDGTEHAMCEDGFRSSSGLMHKQTAYTVLKQLPAVQPDHTAGIGKKVEAEDCISRQAAIDALDEQIEQCNKALGSFYISLKDEYAIKVERASLKAYKEQLENLPPAQPERMRGKWIERNPQNSDKCRLIECDQCGFSHIVGFNVPYEHWIENRNFCERCGADMRGGDSDE